MIEISRQQRYQLRYPDRQQARAAVTEGLRTGLLVRPTKCGKCGKDCCPEAHHHDYLKPLEVEWLCVACHAETRRLPKTMKRTTIFMTPKLISELMSYLGKQKSKAKARASRINGRKGGRPRKVKQ
jgi:hypothetical protein